jgi:hypothetical protein
MFQHTIQDVLGLCEADDSPKALLAAFRTLVAAFEPIDACELILRREGKLRRFEVEAGLNDIGGALLDALGAEPTLRIDTAADLAAQGLKAGDALNSVLVLRLATDENATAAIVLAQRRPWSFAATPLSRVRTLANVLLRLLTRSEPRVSRASSGLAGDEATVEIAGLRTRIASLEDDIAGLRGRRKP